MLIYEVNLSIERSILDAYRRWLSRHIQELLGIDGFEQAVVYERIDGNGERVELVVHYRLSGRVTFEHYVREHADRMRADGIARFGDGFSATRRLLEPTDDIA